MHPSLSLAQRLQQRGQDIAVFGVLIVFFWIGVMKFFEFEALALVPLITESPFMSWGYIVFSVQGFSNLIGVVELAAVLLIVLGWYWPKAGLAGSSILIGSLLVTLSFMVSSEVVRLEYGIPVLQKGGGFLLKDLTLLGVSICLFGRFLEKTCGCTPKPHA
ncbi:DUF417 family protein [Herbaspirillum rhizosphaerae]|uniref:DUF417 family protein n=1 Tax=Herbaspirillum rhizosphaerae TaxID=346179 RepID=A0ABW8Z5P7_9BURK